VISEDDVLRHGASLVSDEIAIIAASSGVVQQLPPLHST
jgi:hypothetical protein